MKTNPQTVPTQKTRWPWRRASKAPYKKTLHDVRNEARRNG